MTSHKIVGGSFFLWFLFRFFRGIGAGYIPGISLARLFLRQNDLMVFKGICIIPESNSCELYFEGSDIEGFVERLEAYYPEVRYVNRLMTHSWGQKVVRFYDPDGNLIEVGTPM